MSNNQLRIAYAPSHILVESRANAILTSLIIIRLGNCSNLY